jgi:hypothetical protein
VFADCSLNLVNDNWTLPLGFVEVLILKKVKVFCFDTLLEVFILKGVRGYIIGRNVLDRLCRIGGCGFNTECTEFAEKK